MLKILQYADLLLFYSPNFLVCSYVPLYPAPRSCAQFTVDDLTKNVFDPENVLIEGNIPKRKYYACGFFMRFKGKESLLFSYTKLYQKNIILLILFHKLIY